MDLITNLAELLVQKCFNRLMQILGEDKQTTEDDIKIANSLMNIAREAGRFMSTRTSESSPAGMAGRWGRACLKKEELEKMNRAIEALCDEEWA